MNRNTTILFAILILIIQIILLLQNYTKTGLVSIEKRCEIDHCDSDFDNTHYFIVTKLYYNCFGIN